jgi:hypothetical protein
MACGPAPFSRTIWAPSGCAELIADDGSYLKDAEPVRRVATDAS